MLYGIVAEGQEAPFVPPGGSAGVRFDNTASDNGLTKTATTADNALLTFSMWFKFADQDSQYSLIQFESFNTYFSVNNFTSGDIVGAVLAGPKYLQFGSFGGVWSAGTWNHLLLSVDTNHAASAKLHNIILNGSALSLNPSNTQDTDTAFSIPLNGKLFGIPAASDSLGGAQFSVASFSEVWVAPGVYLTITDVTKFRDVGGNPVDLGANGETPTGSSPAYYFSGDATTFATNLGTGGSMTLIGSMTSVTGPP